jgi:hypothetical protein
VEDNRMVEDDAARRLGYRSYTDWINTLAVAPVSEHRRLLQDGDRIVGSRVALSRDQYRLLQLLGSTNPTDEVVAELGEMGALTASGVLTAVATREWLDALTVTA